jgi:hypothetical protein
MFNPRGKTVQQRNSDYSPRFCGNYRHEENRHIETMDSELTMQDHRVSPTRRSNLVYELSIVRSPNSSMSRKDPDMRSMRWRPFYPNPPLQTSTLQSRTTMPTPSTHVPILRCSTQGNRPGWNSHRCYQTPSKRQYGDPRNPTLNNQNPKTTINVQCHIQLLNCAKNKPATLAAIH